MGAVMPEPEYDLPLDGEGELCVYVLGRISGEGSDRHPAPGDFQLTQTEIRDILACREKYGKLLLVLNVGGVVDLSRCSRWRISCCCPRRAWPWATPWRTWCWQGLSLGKLASTWAKWEDYCQVGDFAQPDDTHYTEGVYVGYRYLTPWAKSPLFPFGYGLGYTTFSPGPAPVRRGGHQVTVRVPVKNTGAAPGKEVVQLYASVPSGKLDQPYQALRPSPKPASWHPAGRRSSP